MNHGSTANQEIKTLTNVCHHKFISGCTESEKVCIQNVDERHWEWTDVALMTLIWPRNDGVRLT